jgi:choline-sulfatase
MKLSRRDFVKCAGAAVAASASLAFTPGSEAAAPLPGSRHEKTGSIRGKGPNFLIILCDEMRFPPVYESDALKRFRRRYLKTQNLLRANGLEFERHYVASSACVPSRASILTGHYPSLHGATETAGGGAKEAWDGDVFWLDPNSVPTFGNYFRAAGYRTYWRGKWHVSNADLIVPGTHTQLVSYDPDTGVPDPAKEALYSAADRLDPYGFSGWIGPDAGCDAKNPLNSGSSVPEPQRGRDLSIAKEGVHLIQELDHDPSSTPWLVVCSFVNPHDIALVGEKTMTDPKWAFTVENCVPSGDPNDENFLFIWDQFQQTLDDDLSTKPQVQASYQAGYPTFVGGIDPNFYWQYYYQLHKNVDQEMGKVMVALLASRFKNDTIVVLTSDHGDVLGAHHYLYQKFYEAYDEAVRVPLIIWNKHLFKDPRSIDALTSHVDLAPTLLGLAGIDPEPIRQQLTRDHSDARPFVGRDLSPIILGEVDPASLNDPVYFMTDDNPTRGLHQSFPDGTTNPSVVQPSHIETVVARLDDGKLWKYSRYFDSPQFWSSPGTPGVDGVEDVVLEQVDKTPPPEIKDDPIDCTITVKATPKPDEFELYNVTDDPMELDNKYNKADYSSQQAALAELLEEQCAQKRLTPCSGDVPGQPLCGQQSCNK